MAKMMNAVKTELHQAVNGLKTCIYLLSNKL